MPDSSKGPTADVEPRVSVVIPTCNRCHALSRCLDALARQTYSDFELIVVDDGSTDNTPAMFERFLHQHPSVRGKYVRNGQRLGANVSRNRGIREARGELVAFLDSDCVPRPDWLERLLAAFTSDSVAAVTGLVEDLPPENVFELAFKGTHRLARPGPAHRLVGGNMCLRRELLLDQPLDEDLAGGCDEEGVFLRLRAAGWTMLAVPDAVVLHEHHYGGRAFVRQAFRGGRSTARLVYKYHLPPRLDLLPFMLTYLTLPLVLLDRWWLLFPAFFFAGALAAITYNDLFRKGKTVGETIRSFPVLLVYYHVRLAGYVLESVMLRLGRSPLRRHRLR
ncbi:MAG: glycosyltransferase family 2 protein [Phycisphaerae bacterium]